MKVNYDVWGPPEDWRDASSYTYYNLGDFKRPKEGVNSYYNAYNNGSLEGGEVPTDLSLAFWGIGKGSILTKPMFLASYWDGDTIKTAAESINDEEISSVPCILGYGSDGEGQYTLSWWNRYAPAENPGEAEWSTSNVINIWSMYREIFTAFNYQKIMLVPFVRVALGSPTDNWGESYVSLKAYIDGMTTGGAYVNHNKILSIGYQVAVGDGSSNRSTGNKELSINIPVNIKGSSRHWEGVKSNRQRDWKWFATEYGINTMLDSGMLNPGSYSYARSISPYRRFDAVDFSSLHNIGDSETGLCYKYCENYKEPDDTQYNSVPIPYYYDPDDEIWKINDSLPWNTNYAHPFPYIECTTANKNQVRDYILKQIAYLGFPFVYDPALATRGKIGDIGVYLPVFSDNGVTTGEYEEGTAALALPNAEWIDGRTGSGYDPYAPGPAGDMDNVTGRNLNFWSSNKYYLMRQYDLDKFLAVVNGLYTGGSTAEEKAEELRRMQVDFKGSNPSDYIVGLYGIPFQWAGGYQALQPVMLGPVEVLPNDSESDTAVELLNPDFNVELLFGEIRVPELGNFLDFEPYTTLMLYVPFCGTCKLDTAEYIGHTVRVVGTLDKHTGELAVRIIRDGLTVTNTMTGNLYVNIPITAQAMGTYETNLHQLQMAAFNREFGLLTGAVTGGVSMGAAAAAGGEGEGGMISPTAPISMAANLIQLPIAMADYEFRITHCQPPVFYSSSASSANQAKFYRKAKLFIKRPVFLDTYNTDIGKYVYSHTVGYACCIQIEHINDMATADHDHLIKCSNVCLTGIPATVEEINAIKQALCSGVYI